MKLIISFNVLLAAYFFWKDPVAATAITVGILAALAVSGLITLIDWILHKHN